MACTKIIKVLSFYPKKKNNPNTTFGLIVYVVQWNKVCLGKEKKTRRGKLHKFYVLLIPQQ